MGSEWASWQETFWTVLTLLNIRRIFQTAFMAILTGGLLLRDELNFGMI